MCTETKDPRIQEFIESVEKLEAEVKDDKAALKLEFETGKLIDIKIPGNRKYWDSLI